MFQNAEIQNKTQNLYRHILKNKSYFFTESLFCNKLLDSFYKNNVFDMLPQVRPQVHQGPFERVF